MPCPKIPGAGSLAISAGLAALRGDVATARDRTPSLPRLLEV
jgi:hypothetical protein